MKCETCRREKQQVEKHTGSGRDIRTFWRKACQKSVDVDVGIATWKALWEAKEAEGQPPPPKPPHWPAGGNSPVPARVEGG